jgi:hypothetical protein
MSTQGIAYSFQTHFWWGKLMRDSVFVNSVKRRWNTLRKTTLNPQRIIKFMDSTQVVLKDPLQRNFGRFPLYGKKVWPNYFVGNNANEELFWMENWITARIAWLDAAINSLDATLVLGVNEEVSIRAYPNPMRDEIKLEFPLKQETNLRVEVYDLAGRSLQRNQLGHFPQGNTILPMNLSNLAAGRYILLVYSEEEIIYRFPIVKSLD